MSVKYEARERLEIFPSEILKRLLLLKLKKVIRSVQPSTFILTHTLSYLLSYI